MRAALITPAIDAMTDPRAFFGADGASNYHHVTTVPKQSRRPDRRALGVAWDRSVPARMGEEYTCVGERAAAVTIESSG